MSRIPRPVSGLSRSLRPSRANSIVSEDDGDDTVLSNGSSVPELSIGDRVRLPGDKIGTLRYRGPTQFKPGDWAGVELDNRQGLNDGTVNDVRYFTCAHGYGIFVPLSCVRRIQPSSDPYAFCNGYRPCSTTPSLPGGRTRNKSKSFAVSPAPMSVSTTPVPNGRRQTRRRCEEYGNDITPSEFPTRSNRLGTHSRAMSMGTEHTTILNAAVLERDKAVSMVEKLKRQVEDLEFQLEEEKARSITEDKPEVANAECQVDVECSELSNLRSCCSRLTQMNRKLLETKKSEENAVRAMSTLCTKLEMHIDTLEKNTVPIKQFQELNEKIKALNNQCSEHEQSNRILQEEINDLRTMHSASIEESKRKVQELEKVITSLEEEKLSSMGQQVMDLMAECHEKEDKINQQSKIIEDLETRCRLSEATVYKSSFTSVNGSHSDLNDSSRYVGSDSNEMYKVPSSSRVSYAHSSISSTNSERSTASRWYSTLNDTLPNSSAINGNNTHSSSTNNTSNATTPVGNKKPLNLFRSMRYP